MNDGWLCGWRIQSVIELPELLPWRGDDRVPDITITIGEMPLILERGGNDNGHVRVAADGTCQLRVPGVAAFQVSRGRSILVEPWVDPASAIIRTLLLGTVLGIVCHQRGVVPLHASCVQIGRGAVAFAGPSGAGKSSIAAALWRLGYPILGDDVCVLSFVDGQTPIVTPAFPRLRLWQDGIEAFTPDARDLTPVAGEMAKFNVPVVDQFRMESQPLAAVYHLAAEPASGELRSPMGAVEAVHRLRASIYRRRAAGVAPSDSFGAATRIAGEVPQWLLRQRSDLTDLVGIARRVAAWHPAS